MGHIVRISAENYIPTTGAIAFLFHVYLSSTCTLTHLTDDILHARVQTLGVAEHGFGVNMHGNTVTWHIYDVGGARGQRHTWVPFFDDANAIIFVAPISAFDQVRNFSFRRSTRLGRQFGCLIGSGLVSRNDVNMSRW
jgi:hypothetical protein